MEVMMPIPSPARRVAALAVLGLPARATGQQITDAYRRLARTTHPDATGRTDTAAGRRFAEISDAYHLLTDDPAAEQAVAQGEPTSAGRTAGTGGSPGQPRRTRWRGRDRPGRPPIVAGPVTITRNAADQPRRWRPR
jgi:curved DNA-binding protein CbpA